MNIPDKNKPRIVVIGAGFAGLQIAKNIDTDAYQLVLIDKNNFHTFQPLLYQVATSGLEPDSIAYPIRKILNTKQNSYFRLASVGSIDTEKSIIFSDIGELKYDYLIIASGAKNNYFDNDLIKYNSISMKSLEDSLNLRSKILGNFERALNTNDLNKRKELMNVVIVGAGPTGVELAGAIAELRNKVLPKDFPDLDFRLMEINLIEAAPRVLSGMNEESSNKANSYLNKLGINVWTDTFVKSYENNLVKTSNIDFHTDTLVWSAGVKGNFPDGILHEQITKNNRIKTDEYCRVFSYDNIFAVGDASNFITNDSNEGLPMMGSVAMQQGKYLAEYFNNKSKNKETKPFAYNDKGTMATIGRNKAVVELSNFSFQGIFAWLVWMFVHLMLLVGFRNRVVVLINWTWNYIKFNNGLRLIVRPFQKKSKAETSTN